MSQERTINFTVLDREDEEKSVTFFDDDTIENVRQKIAIAVNSHPNRVCVFANVTRPANYYSSNSKNWETLFHRLSYGTNNVLPEALATYNSQRNPSTEVRLESQIGRHDWMDVFDGLDVLLNSEEPFNETVLFGVEDVFTFVLPVDPLNAKHLDKLVGPTKPRPDDKLIVQHFYPDVASITSFNVVMLDERRTAEAYFPFYVEGTTPTNLSPEIQAVIRNRNDRLKGMLSLDVPDPVAVSYLRLRYSIPFIETKFDTISYKLRFEQIFYGITLSEETPYIGYFTGDDNTRARHKFFVEDSTDKKPFQKMSDWKAWVGRTRPKRSSPTLVFYRGKDSLNFDRLVISHTDIIATSYRDNKKSKSREEIREKLHKWIESLDAVMPYIDPKDLHPSRWEIRDLSMTLKYEKPLDRWSPSRLQCLNMMYDVIDKDKLRFRLLRDASSQEYSPEQMKVLQIFEDGISVNVNEIQKRLEVPPTIAAELFEFGARIAESRRGSQKDNKLLTQRDKYGFPVLVVGKETVLIESSLYPDRSIEYANILRYVLSNPQNETLDRICPRPIDYVPQRTLGVTVASNIDDFPNDTSDDLDISDFADLLEDEKTKEQDAQVEGVIEEILEQPKQEEDIDVAEEEKTSYGYFFNRLKTFDPDTFTHELKGATRNYPAICEQKRQPIVIKEADLNKVGREFNPLLEMSEDDKKYQTLPITNSRGEKGVLICPEYWCIVDEIPLRANQLIQNEDGSKACPKCKGLIQSVSTKFNEKYPVVERDADFKYIGYTKGISMINNNRLPCCYMSRETTSTKEKPQKHQPYILNDSASASPKYRLAHMRADLLKILGIEQTYKDKSIINGGAGFFRVGLENAGRSLPFLIGKDMKDDEIPRPKDRVKELIKCSFVATWTGRSDKNLEEIEARLKRERLNPALAPIISSIDETYWDKKELTPIQELEYAAIILNCNIHQIVYDSKLNTYKLECFFWSEMFNKDSPQLAVIRYQNGFDLICHASPTGGKKIQYNPFINKAPFPEVAYELLSTERNISCAIEKPSYNSARKVFAKYFSNIVDDIDEVDSRFILDPYGRAQALYVEGKFILPFTPVPLPDGRKHTDSPGYIGLNLPRYDAVVEYLEVAKDVSPEYEMTQYLTNYNGERVEVLLKCGLRIPVVPQPVEDQVEGEIIETVNTITESDLVFGEEDASLKKLNDSISYESEIFEYLLYTLSKNEGTENSELMDKLRLSNPTRADIEEPLREWYDREIFFTDLGNPYNFISKVRTPCKPLDAKQCTKLPLCAIKNKKCMVKVNTKGIDKNKLFNRIVSTLIDNFKIRSSVVEGRMSPFFSTVLYIELPNELIITDREVPLYK